VNDDARVVQPVTRYAHGAVAIPPAPDLHARIRAAARRRP
jgi:hypothetical protein